MKNLKKKVIFLRKQGKTYGEIQKILKCKIPKSTLSFWCKNIELSNQQKLKIEVFVKRNIEKGRQKALRTNKLKREKYFHSIEERVGHLKNIIQNKDVAKIALAMLYLGEGSKTLKSSLTFGNSDPQIIRLFIDLLRSCYQIDERKFRCTLQARADQNIKELEEFWSTKTKIPLNQFYKARVDSRTIGKVSRKKDYKGVCRIDYFSADIFWELIYIMKSFNGPVA